MPTAGSSALRVKARGQLRRLCLDVRADHPDHRPGQGDLRPLPHPGDPHRLRLRLHQHRAGRRHPRRRQARGAVPARAPGRHRRPRDRPHAGRAAPAQPAQGRRHALRRGERLHLRRRRLRAAVRDGAARPPTSRASRRGAPPAKRRASGAASGLSCHLHGTGGIADEHVVVAGRARPAGGAASARRARARATRRCSPRSCRRRSACRSSASRSARATRAPSRTAAAPAARPRPSSAARRCGAPPTS